MRGFMAISDVFLFWAFKPVWPKPLKTNNQPFHRHTHTHTHNYGTCLLRLSCFIKQMFEVSWKAFVFSMVRYLANSSYGAFRAQLGAPLGAGLAETAVPVDLAQAAELPGTRKTHEGVLNITDPLNRSPRAPRLSMGWHMPSNGCSCSPYTSGVPLTGF